MQSSSHKSATSDFLLHRCYWKLTCLVHSYPSADALVLCCCSWLCDQLQLLDASNPLYYIVFQGFSLFPSIAALLLVSHFNSEFSCQHENYQKPRQAQHLDRQWFGLALCWVYKAKPAHTQFSKPLLTINTLRNTNILIIAFLQALPSAQENHIIQNFSHTYIHTQIWDWPP